MRVMVLDAPGRPLRLADLPRREPGPGEVLVEVLACGVCRTDLHVVAGGLRVEPDAASRFILSDSEDRQRRRPFAPAIPGAGR